MNVNRSHCNKNYTVINNELLRDERLSLKAKGMLCVVLSLPNEWECSLEGFTKIFREGKDAIRSTFNELEEAGYLVRGKERNGKGQWLYTYDWFATPRRKTRVGKSVSENPTQLNKDNKVNINNNTINSIIVGKPKMNEKIAVAFNKWESVMGIKMKSSKLNGIACKRLIDFCGGDEQKLCKVIEALPVMIKEQGEYAIRVSDFVELEKKWNKIMAWGRQKMIAKQAKLEEKKADEEYKPFE